MNLLVYGGFGQASIENQFINEWVQSPHIGILRKLDRLQYFGRKSLIRRVLARISPWLDWAILLIQKAVIDEVIRNQIDLVIAFKGMELSPMLLRMLKRRGVKLVCYNPDHPFIYSGRGSGNSWMTKSIKLYDLYLTYDIQAARSLEKIGVSTSIIPFGYEIECIKENFVSEENELISVCFVGNPDVHRAAFIDEFAKTIRIDLYGHSWENFVSATSNIRFFDAVYGQEHWQTLSRYRVHLNLLRPHNLNGHNMRTFSVPAAGGIMLAPFTDDHKRFFLDRREVFLFDDVDDAKRIADEILGFDYVVAQEIRHSARERSLRSDYSYKRRAQDMLFLCLSVNQ